MKMKLSGMLAYCSPGVSTPRALMSQKRSTHSEKAQERAEAEGSQEVRKRRFAAAGGQYAYLVRPPVLMLYNIRTRTVESVLGKRV